MSLENQSLPPEPRSVRTLDLRGPAALLFGLLVLLVGLAGGYAVRRGIAAAETGPLPSGQSGAAPTPASMMAFALDQVRHFEGDPNAPVTMIEFSDFQ
ncbi:MAG TPA: hypothetical protein VLS48_01170 [Anaerolineales bacterium]|nr:hypothetical protein [Anaerolineales bacterium]